MAVTIMAGFTFGTILTMVLVPTLYCTLFRVKSPGKGSTGNCCLIVDVWKL